MDDRTRLRSGAAALLGTLALLPQAVVAQEYPTRPIRWIVPVPPGATTDILSRVIGAKMTDAWGQQVIVDNRSGGAFVVGTEIIAKANPDGYTIGILLTPHVVNPFVMKNLPYDSVKDFQPITQVVFVPGVMVANASLPANNLKEVIALAKAKPGQLNFGSPGAMTSGHLSMELLNLVAGIKITHVPYKGGAPAIVDLLGGQIQFVVLGPPTVMPHLKAGRLKAIATTAAKRSPGLPGHAHLRRVGPAGLRHLRVVRHLRAGEDAEGGAPEVERRDQPHHQAAGRERALPPARRDPARQHGRRVHGVSGRRAEEMGAGGAEGGIEA